MSKKAKCAAKARAVFDTYAAMDTPDLPFEQWSALQVRLCRWQSRNFGGATIEHVALGVSEEAGELCHAVLKAQQKIRGYDDKEKLRADAGDAIADCAIYLIQACTILRLDFATLVSAVARDVMDRDWVEAPGTGETFDCETCQDTYLVEQHGAGRGHVQPAEIDCPDCTEDNGEQPVLYSIPCNRWFLRSPGSASSQCKKRYGHTEDCGAGI